MGHPDGAAPLHRILDIEPEFRAEFDRDLTELTATLDAIIGQYDRLLRPNTLGLEQQTPDRAVATIAKMGDRMAESGVWTPETVHRLLAVAVRTIHEHRESGRMS